MNKSIIRKLLDKLFSAKKLALYLPLSLAAVMLVLGGIFGEREIDLFLFFVTGVIFSAVWFAFVYSLVRLPARFKNCSDWYTDSFELFLTIAFALSAILQTVNFIKDASGFSLSLCFGCLLCRDSDKLDLLMRLNLSGMQRIFMPQYGQTGAVLKTLKHFGQLRIQKSPSEFIAGRSRGDWFRLQSTSASNKGFRV
jgi:hypothetical protein